MAQQGFSSFMEDLNRLSIDHPLRSLLMKKESDFHDNAFMSDHVLATPLLELLSVRIYMNDEKAIKLYGAIKVIDGEGATFDVYNQEVTDQETSSGDSLVLTIPMGRVISPSGRVRVDIDIKDSTRNISIVDDHLFLDYSIKDDYDQVQTEKVYGHCGHVAVDYITYRHAVIANVEVLVRGISDDASSFNIFGEIVAYCSDTSSIILFDKKQNQSVTVKSGCPIPLSRYVVAVPACCSLEIATSLYHRDTGEPICVQSTEFEPIHNFDKWTQKFEGHNGIVKVSVQWSHLHMQSPPESKLEQKIEEVNEENLNDNKLQVNSDSLLPSSVDRNPLSDTRRLSAITPTQVILLLEIFSVNICSDNGEDFNLWGSIKVFHRGGETLIYSREKKNAEKFLPNQTAILSFPAYCFSAYALRMETNLLDAEDNVISNACLWWDERCIDRPIQWNDKPLCSVICGATGYAAVHYTVISSGVQATVKVCIVSKNSSSTSCLQVHGTVYTEYSNYRYVTRYEKEHYRSKLFERHLENPEMLSSDFQVPLSKSVLVVPYKSSLIVGVELTVTPPQTQAPSSNVKTTDDFSQVFRDRLSFSADDSKSDQIIEGSRHDVVVSVEWGRVYFPDRDEKVYTGDEELDSLFN